MADFDFKEENKYFDKEDDFEFAPGDDLGYSWHNNYGFINRNRPDVPLKSEYEIDTFDFVFGEIDKTDAFNRFWDADRSARHKQTHPLKFYVDPKTDKKEIHMGKKLLD